MQAPVIAVLDVDPAFLLFMNAVLTDEGYETALWCDSDTAPAMVQRVRPDLIILDERGCTVLDSLWNNVNTRTIPVIVCISDTTPPEQQADILRERRCAVMCAPFDSSELLGLIDSTLDDSAGLLPHMPDASFAFPLTLDG